MEPKVVSALVWDPSKSLFKMGKNKHAECKTVTCTLDSCPLRDAGACMWKPALSWTKCPYGTYREEKGPTRRARSFSRWVSEHKAKYQGIPNLGSPIDKIAFVGDYVYLPYAHMDMNEGLPFPEHSHVFRHGCCLLPRKAWTIENVLKIVGFRPHALLGGEITYYQKKSVPKFVEHLREVDKPMWDELVKARPHFDTTPNYVGRKARLATLNSPIEWSTDHKDYPVVWKWDGKTLETSSEDAYNSTWGKVRVKEVRITALPADDAVVEVRDDSWVNENTVFVD